MVKHRAPRYTQQDAAAAVEMYLSGPEGLHKVAKALGVSWSTLQRWVQLHRAAHPEDVR